MNKPSRGGEKYIFTFIDDLSRITWVYFMKNRNLVFQKFKEFMALAEKWYGRPIKFLTSQNGGEYESQ